MDNREIADVFREMAQMLQILDGNPFRIRSFQRAAQVIADLPEGVEEMLEDRLGQLKSVAGIGSGTIARIEEIVRTGSCREREELRQKVPPRLLELLKLENLGPRKVARLWKELGVTTLSALNQALDDGRVRELPGMGVKSASKLREALESHQRRGGRFRLDHAIAAGDAILEHLERDRACGQLSTAGSLRRRKESIGDIDVLATSKKPERLIAWFLQYPAIQEVAAQGTTKASVRLRGGLACDLRVVDDQAFGAALQYFTGCQAHNVALRERAKRMGLKISEYGLFSNKTEKRLAGRKEEQIYRRLQLAFIPPELRENRGEIEAAEKGVLPPLIEEACLKGDLHLHTRASDGRNSIAEMAEAARRLGYQYIAVTDHSQALAVTGGLDAEALRRQFEEIRRFNDSDPGITLLSGVEVEILADGKLDLDDRVLERADLVIAAVHSRLGMERGRMTRRICRALEHPEVNILAHPTGRILGKRDGCQLDWDQILETARRQRVCLEVNADPKRLDLSDVGCRRAGQHGVLLSINSDAHRREALASIRYGIYTARRGWLTAPDVINTYSLNKLRKVLAKQGGVFPE